MEVFDDSDGNAFNDYRIHIIQYMWCYQLSILTLNSVKCFISLLPIIFIRYHYVESIPINDMLTTEENMKTNVSYLCSLHAIQILQKLNPCSIRKIMRHCSITAKKTRFQNFKNLISIYIRTFGPQKNIYNRSGRPHMQCILSRRSCKAHNWAL